MRPPAPPYTLLHTSYAQGDTLIRVTVTVDLQKVRDNTERVVGTLPGIAVVAVTKVTCGSPQVGRAMLAGGARALGDSRLENAQRLRDAGLTAPIWLLRAPPPEGLVPVDSRVQVLGASSDHLILDVHDLERPPALGEAITFVPNYGATLALFTSPYVQKVFTPPA